MAGSSDTISTNGTTFTVGDTLIITFSLYNNQTTCSGALHIGNTTYSYSHCSNPKTGQEAKDTNPFLFTLTEAGTYSVYYVNNMYGRTSNTITITVEDDTPSVPTTSWTIGNKTVESLHINNKEVQSITRLSDNVVIYANVGQIKSTRIVAIDYVGYYLEDEDGNGLNGKTVTLTEYGQSSPSYTITTPLRPNESDGFIASDGDIERTYRIGYPHFVFEGDEAYEGCSATFDYYTQIE